MRRAEPLLVFFVALQAGAQVEVGAWAGAQYDLVTLKAGGGTAYFAHDQPDGIRLEGWGGHAALFVRSSQGGTAFMPALIFTSQQVATDYGFYVAGSGTYTGLYQEWQQTLRVPLWISMRITDRSHLQLGPEPFFALAQKSRDEGAYQLTDTSQVHHYFEEYNGGDTGLPQGGFGLGLHLSQRFPSGLLMGVSYWRSFPGAGYEGPERHDNVFHFSIGWSFITGGGGTFPYDAPAGANGAGREVR